MAREPEQRIRELVMAAVELNFQIIVGAPVVEPTEIYRVRPPIRPDEPLPGLRFYIGKKVWDSFMFLAERYPEVMKAVDAADIEYYKHPAKDGTDGTSEGGGAAVQ